MLRRVVIPAADYVQVSLVLINAQTGRMQTRRGSFILLLFGMLGLALTFWRDGTIPLGFALFFGFLSLLGGATLLFDQFLPRRLATTHTQSIAPTMLPTDYTFAADALSSHNELHSSTLAWTAVQRADVVGHWLLLYLTNKTFLWLDLRQLAPPATAADLYALLAQHHIPVRELPLA